MEPFVIILIMVAIVAAIFFGWYLEKKRRDEFAAMAGQLGLRFSPDKNRALASELGFLDKLAHGSNRYACNVMQGEYCEHVVWVFDYHYQVQSGKSTRHYNLSVFVLGLRRRFPELRIGPEGILSKLAQAVGYEDIDFESHEFSRAFCVRSADRKFAYDVCNARMMEFLLDNRDLCVEIENNVLAVVFDRRLKVEQIPANLDRLVTIRDLMPDFLFDGGAT